MMNEASSSGSNRSESVVVDAGKRRSSCGYCKSGSHSSVSHGMWANNLTVQDYQDLLDRGWRRSGCFLYKPEMETTCCPSYTIRLRAGAFLPSKEQLRVSRRLDRYLNGTLDVKKQNKLAKMPNNFTACNSQAISPADQNEEKSQEEQFMIYLSDHIDKALRSCVAAGDLPNDIQIPSELVKKVSQTKKKRLVDGFEDLLYTTSISFLIAASLSRMTSAQNDFEELGSSKGQVVGPRSSHKSSPQLIAEKIVSALQNLVEIPDWTVRACNGHINFYSAAKKEACGKQDTSAVLCGKSGSPCKGKEQNKKVEEPLTEKRELEIRLKRSTFDPVEFALYKKYQVNVHNDKANEVKESSYRRFLVDTPLTYVPPTSDQSVPPCGFGSFHQQYVIDGKLVAVGVIDILPKCLSSKYLFWDPDYAFLSLGKLSALKEIDWVKENSRHCPSLQYYYLGYYIHSCNKMRYKAAYHPSELLCPLRYQFVPFSIAKPLLDKRKYAVLSDSCSSQKQDSSLPAPKSLTDGEYDGLNHVEGDNEMHDADSESSDDVHVEEGNEVHDADSESSDDDSLPETDSPLTEADGDVGNILIKYDGIHLKYKDFRRYIDPAQCAQLETRLRRYMKATGPQLSERMLYSLN